jgi:SAM-dependent methyltransferase
MKLSTPEFRAMQSLPRRLGQRYFELPAFLQMGLSVRGRDVLEIGCGSGYGAYLIQRLEPRSYVGIDTMAEQIQLARTNYPEFKFVLQDAADLGGFDSGSTDIAILFGVLHHIPQWRRVVEEIARVLRPGGSLFLEEPRGMDLKIFDFLFRWAHPQTDFSLPALEDHIEACGLKLARKRWTPLLTMYSIHRPG